MSVHQRVSSLVQRAYREYFLPTARNLTGPEVDRLEVFSGELVGILEDLVRSVVGQKPAPPPAAPATVAGWVVRARHPERGVIYVVTAGGGTEYADRDVKPYVFTTRNAAQNIADSPGWVRTWTRTILPVDAAGNVLEERAEQPAPAPREPDGWIVVDDRGRCPDPCTWVVARRGTYVVVRCVRCGMLRTVTRSVAARMTGGRDDG